MKHLKLYESISNYQVKIFTKEEFSKFLNENREKYNPYDEENEDSRNRNDLKSKIKYFD